MAIKSGETTYHQAKRGIVQNGLVLNLDAGVDASYDGGTTWRDLEGGNNGTLTNGPTFDRDNGGSIVFDGSDDYVSLGEGGLSFPNDSADFTCEVVVKLHTVTSQQVFFQQEDFGGTGRSWIFLRNNGGNHAFSSYLGSSDLLLTSLGVPTSGTIYHVHIKYESGVLYIGYNGVWYQSSTRSIDEGCTGGFRIGTGKNTTPPTDGNIYYVRVYNRALTAAEVLQNYNVTRHRFGV